MSMVPYEMPPQGGLIAPGGQDTCFTLDFPSRAVISKIIIKQLSGAPVDFTATLYNKQHACDGSAGSDSLGETRGVVPSELYKVTPDLGSDSAGYLEYFSDTSSGGHGFVFFNQDNDPNDRRLGNPRKIYLKLSPQGSGDKEFAIALAGEIHQ